MSGVCFLVPNSGCVGTTHKRPNCWEAITYRQVRAQSLSEGRSRRGTPFFLQPHFESGELWQNSEWTLNTKQFSLYFLNKPVKKSVLFLEKIFWIVKDFWEALHFLFCIIGQLLWNRLHLRYLGRHIFHDLLGNLMWKTDCQHERTGWNEKYITGLCYF